MKTTNVEFTEEELEWLKDLGERGVKEGAERLGADRDVFREKLLRNPHLQLQSMMEGKTIEQGADQIIKDIELTTRMCQSMMIKCSYHLKSLNRDQKPATA